VVEEVAAEAVTVDVVVFHVHQIRAKAQPYDLFEIKALVTAIFSSCLACACEAHTSLSQELA
jgi:hypothetical protein